MELIGWGGVNVVSLLILVKFRNEAKLPVMLPLFRTPGVPPPSCLLTPSTCVSSAVLFPQ